MTVTALPSRKLIAATGQDELEFSIYIESASHIAVWADEELLDLGTDYTVDGVGEGAGFTVTILEPDDWDNDLWIIEHFPPINQQADLSVGGTFGRAYEDAVDAITRRMQSLEDGVERSFKTPRTRTVGLEAPVMDVLAEDHFWKADADGNMVDGGSAADIINAQAYAALTAADRVAVAADRVIAEFARDLALAAVPIAQPTSLAQLALLPANITKALLFVDGMSGSFELVDNTGGTYDDLIAADTGAGSGGEITESSVVPDFAWLRTRKRGDLVKLSEEGDNLQRAINVAKERARLFGPDNTVVMENNLVGGGALTSGLIIPDEVEPVDLGEDKFVWDASGLTAANLVRADGTITGAGGLFAVYFGPPPASRYSAALPEFSPIAVGQSWIDFVAPHGLTVGQVVLVQKYATFTFGNFGVSRSYYRMAQRSRIVGVVGNRVYTAVAFRDAYTWSNTPGSEVLAHRQVMRKGRIGFSIDLWGAAQADTRGIYLSSVEGQEFRDLQVRGAGYAAITLDQCYDCSVHPSVEASTNLRNPFPGSGLTNDYGLLISNCTDIDIYDPNVAANWHPFSIGGAADLGNGQNHRIIVHDMDLTSTGTGTPHSMDMHGNSDECGFIGCTASPGMSLNGRDAFADKCKIVGKAGNTAKLVNMTELHSGKMRFTDCEFSTPNNSGTATTAGQIFGLVQAGSQGEIEFIFDGCHLNMPNEQQPIQLNAAAGGTYGYSFAWIGDGRVNIPSTSFGVARLNNDALVASAYCRMPRDPGLVSGKAYVAHLNYAPAKTEFPSQTIAWSDTATASASYSSGVLTYPNSYPSFHTVNCSPGVNTGAGIKSLIKHFSQGTASVRLQLATGDGTNLTAAAFVANARVF